MPLVMLGPIAAAYEHAMTDGEGRNTWRTDRYSPCPRTEAAGYLKFLVCPVIQDEDVAVIGGEDGWVRAGPAGWVLAGPWCAWWRGGGQSVVTSVMAVRALCSSTMDLRPAQAATRAWVAMLLTARGRPRAASWMRAAASSLKIVSERPASLT